MRYLFLILTIAFHGNLLAQVAQRYVPIPAGLYALGSNHHVLNPLRKVRIAEFQIANIETTNRQFDLFVTATQYITTAEQHHNANVFEPGLEEFRWLQDSTAYWRFPNGIGRGGIGEKMDHPVTCISYVDAQAYCKWAGVRLPTLDEWEVTARANSNTEYFLGSDKKELAQYANVWVVYQFEIR